MVCNITFIELGRNDIVGVLFLSVCNFKVKSLLARILLFHGGSNNCLILLGELSNEFD